MNGTIPVDALQFAQDETRPGGCLMLLGIMGLCAARYRLTRHRALVALANLLLALAPSKDEIKAALKEAAQEFVPSTPTDRPEVVPYLP